MLQSGTAAVQLHTYSRSFYYRKIEIEIETRTGWSGPIYICTYPRGYCHRDRARYHHKRVREKGWASPGARGFYSFVPSRRFCVSNPGAESQAGRREDGTGSREKSPKPGGVGRTQKKEERVEPLGRVWARIDGVIYACAHRRCTQSCFQTLSGHLYLCVWVWVCMCMCMCVHVSGHACTFCPTHPPTHPPNSPFCPAKLGKIVGQSHSFPVWSMCSGVLGIRRQREMGPRDVIFSKRSNYSIVWRGGLLCVVFELLLSTIDGLKT